VVKVGSPDNQIVFAPNTIMAKPGEMVQFQFYSQVRIPPARDVHHPSNFLEMY
jgi:plastocyanin